MNTLVNILVNTNLNNHVNTLANIQVNSLVNTHINTIMSTPENTLANTIVNALVNTRFTEYVSEHSSDLDTGQAPNGPNGPGTWAWTRAHPLGATTTVDKNPNLTPPLSHHAQGFNIPFGHPSL